MDIEFFCTQCGSTDVRRDAWAEWSREDQKWVLGERYDEGYCMTCAGYQTLDSRPIDKYPREDWQYEVNNGDTNLGYDDWKAHKREAKDS